MKKSFLVIPLCAGLIFGGCADPAKKFDALVARPGDEKPPDFVTGPACVALTNFAGFSASVVATESVVGVATNYAALGGRTDSGQLIERAGRFIYQPMTTAQPKKGEITRGGMFFIWDAGGRQGYVCSEALQAFAPLDPPVAVAQANSATNVLLTETVGGHPCHKVDTVLDLADGSQAKLTEWQAEDLQHFPMQIQVSYAGKEWTINFSDVRMDLANAELFFPPPDFTRYPTSLAMINELMIRQSSLRTSSLSEDEAIPYTPGVSPRPPGQNGSPIQ